MVPVETKYAFPLFTKHNSTDYLIKHDQIRVSDIWSFWQYIIERYVKKYSGNKDFLSTLLKQAQYFYEAAENAPIKSQPLLYYYSFLNLVKVVINVNALTIYGLNFNYNHGVDSCDINSKSKLSDLYVEIKGLQLPPGAVPKPGKLPDLSVAYTLMKQLGDSVTCPPRFRLSIEEMLKSCVGIHRTYCETYNIKENFIRLGGLQLLKHGKRFYAKYNLPKCSVDNANKLIAAGYNIIDEVDKEGLHSYYWQETIILSSNTVSKIDYFLLATSLRNKGIWYFTDGCSYTPFISTSPMKISTESIIYLLMFFFGSVTRYHPYLFDSMMTDKQLWVISEFLKTQPKQFLYSITSRTIESAILKPATANIL